MLTPVTIMVLDKLPKHNTGALVREFSEFVFDDAAIIACLLRQWGMPTGMIGTTVGDDPRGHALADQLREWGVQGNVRFSSEFKTPMEVNVSDKTGARTYFSADLTGAGVQLGKLDAPNRSAATSIALREQLVDLSETG